MESYPYETVQRDYDYVRLASITAGKFTDHLLSRFYTYLPYFEDVSFYQEYIALFMPKANRAPLCYWDIVHK